MTLTRKTPAKPRKPIQRNKKPLTRRVSLRSSVTTEMRKPRKPIKRKTFVKPKNVARRAKEFARCYGSAERVEFVKSLPCAACGVVGYSENAHVIGNGGAGRKANADTIAPLCGRRPNEVYPMRMLIGCHRMYDERRDWFDRSFPHFNPEEAARETQAAWLAAGASQREERA